MDSKKNRALEERRNEPDRRSEPRQDRMPERRRAPREGDQTRHQKRSPAIWYDKPADWI